MVGTLWRRSAFGGLATFAVTAMLVGCVPLTATPTVSESSTGSAFLPCMVSNDAGFDDHSVNAQGLAGFMTAVGALGVSEVHVQSNEQADYAPNINLLLDDGCNLIVVVGPELRTAAVAVAKTNPKVNIAILGDSVAASGDGATDLPNVKSIVSDTAQAAFLSGYVAAGYSKAGVVGTYGAENTPQIAQTMDGFSSGVAYYNAQKEAHVTVVGWDPVTQDGSFVGRDVRGEKATAMAASLIEQNADVLLPVESADGLGAAGLGAAGLGAAHAILQSGKEVALIGSGSDLFLTDPMHAELYLTSLVQDLTGAVSTVVKEAADGGFDNTTYVGTLASGGVGIAPFHDFEAKVDPALPGELDAIKVGIANGTIAVGSFGIGSSPTPSAGPGTAPAGLLDHRPLDSPIGVE